MHAVYFVRPGENEELRYSLRSVEQNTGVEYLTIIGDKPDWCHPDEFVQGNPGTAKYPNVLANLQLALERFPGEFTIFNDDFYVLKPLERLPLYYRQTLRDHTMSADTRFPEGRLRRQLLNKLDVYLRRKTVTSYSFEVHVPLPVNGDELDTLILEYWDEMSGGTPEPLMWRSLYGNLSEKPIEFRNDVVYHGPNDFDEARDFASTSDRSVEPILPRLERLFPESSRWEK